MTGVPSWTIANIDTMKVPALEALLADMGATGHGITVASDCRNYRKVMIAAIRSAREDYWTALAADQARADAADAIARRARGRAPSAATKPTSTISAAEVNAWLRTLPRPQLAGDPHARMEGET